MNASDAVDKHRHYDIVKGQKSFFVECVSIYYLLTILFFVQIVEKKLGHISESDQKNIDNKWGTIVFSMKNYIHSSLAIY